MAEYTTKAEVLTAITDCLDRIPNLNVTIAKHGTWEEARWLDGRVWPDYAKCSECKNNIYIGIGSVSSLGEVYKYCPYCGAKMDLKEEVDE